MTRVRLEGSTCSLLSVQLVEIVLSSLLVGLTKVVGKSMRRDENCCGQDERRINSLTSAAHVIGPKPLKQSFGAGTWIGIAPRTALHKVGTYPSLRRMMSAKIICTTKWLKNLGAPGLRRHKYRCAALVRSVMLMQETPSCG